jgi:hypothetical protein
MTDTPQTVLDAAAQIADGFYRERNIDWMDLLERVELWTGYDFGTDVDSAEIRRVKKHVRAHRA